MWKQNWQRFTAALPHQNEILRETVATAVYKTSIRCDSISVGDIIAGHADYLYLYLTWARRSIGAIPLTHLSIIATNGSFQALAGGCEGKDTEVKTEVGEVHGEPLAEI